MTVFGVQNSKPFFLLFGLLPGNCLSISESKFQCLGLPNRGFRMESVAQIDFSRKLFLMEFGIVCFLLEALGSDLQFLWALETGLKMKLFFCDATDPEPVSGGADHGVFWSL